MSSIELQTALQAHLDNAVAVGVAPALQCIVVDKEKVLYNAISGLASLPSGSAPDGKPFTNDSTILLASCTKVILSIVTLSVLEKGQTKNGMGIEHLDDHDKLAEIIPELSPSSNSILTKILEGFEDGHDAEGRKIMKLRDAKNKITLRMLLTHTSGMACNWTNPLLAELYGPTDGSVPHKQRPVQSGKTVDYLAPLVCEPNTEFRYSISSDWIGEFLVRTTGKSLRRLYEEHVLGPLGISRNHLDILRSPEIENNLADIYHRAQTGQFTKLDLFLYSTEDLPPPGYTVHASGAFWGTALAFAQVIQAVLNEDHRLLSREVWQLAIQDDLGPRGLKVPSPEMPYANPLFSSTFVVYFQTIPEHQIGANLLQAKVASSPSVTGRSAGSFGWAGGCNTHWVVDLPKGVGILLVAHLFPFMDPTLVQTRDEIEKLIYSYLDIHMAL